MKSFAILVTLILFGSVVHADAPQASQFRFPNDGNDLLQFCEVIVNELDSPPTQVDALNEMKLGWCVGYLQATQDLILNWRLMGAIQVMSYQEQGKPIPAHMWGDEDFVNTCIPDQASVGQLARVTVKWLREHPNRLHELKGSLLMESLKNAFPCPVTAKDTVKQGAGKP